MTVENDEEQQRRQIEEEEEAFLAKFLRKPGDPRPAYAFQSENLAEEMEKVPLFMTKPPQEGGNVILDAIQAILYEGSPTEIATNFKERGNEAYLAGQHADALEFYNRGLEQDSLGADPLLMVTLHLNRAAVHLGRQNYRMALGDCEAALGKLGGLECSSSTTAQMVKAHVRASKALTATGKHQEARRHLEMANQLHPGSPEIEHLLTTNRTALQVHLIQLEAQAKQEKIMNRVRLLLRRRNVTHVAGCERDLLALVAPSESGSLPDLGSVQFVPQSATHLRWPVFLLYPPYGQLDFIAAWDERINFAAQLGTVFEQPPPWDVDGLYSRRGLGFHVYYNPPTTRLLYRVGLERRLEELIGTVIREVDLGILAFYVLPANHTESFLSKFEPPLMDYL